MQSSVFGIGYAYDSHMSYEDHLRHVDAARKGGEVAGQAAERGARRIETAIAVATYQLAGAVTQVTDALGEVSSEIRASNEIMEWGFSAMLNEMAEMGTTLSALLKCARTPSQTWAYEQFEIARENYRKGNYGDCLKRLDYAIEGHQTHLGYPEGWQLHQLKGDVYLQCLDRDLIDLPKAENCFLTAAKYADTPNEKAMALIAAAVAAYNQGRMEAAEDYARRACEAKNNLAEAHFQLARIRLHRRNGGEAWEAALRAITLDHRYAARLPLDSEFLRNAEVIDPAWKQYAKDLRSRLEAVVQSAAETMCEFAKSREEARRLKNSRAFEIFDLAGQGLAKAEARFEEMTRLANAFSAEAKKCRELLAGSLRRDTVFAFLEVEHEIERVTILAAGALAASREAELTLRKVEQLSREIPDSFPLLRLHAMFSTISKRSGILFVGGVFYTMFLIGLTSAFAGGIIDSIGSANFLGAVILSYLIGITILAWAMGKEAATREGIEQSNWREANLPQTSAKRDGSISRANEALSKGAKPDDWDEIDPDDMTERIAMLVRDGQTIAAINLYSQQTGCDIGTAKAYVGQLAFDEDWAEEDEP